MNRRGALHALAAVAVAVSLAGCLKLDMSLDIAEDETVDGHIIMAVSEELARLSGQDPQELAEEFRNDVMSDAPEGVTQEPYQAEGFQGTRMVMDDVPLDEFDFSDDETLSIVHEGDEYVVNGVLDLTGATELGELSGEEQELVEGLAETMDVQVAVTFPGEVIEHNGELDGRTVTWAPAFGESLDIEARAEDSGGSSFPWLIVGVVAGLLAIGALAVLALRRRAGAAASEEPVATAADEPTGVQEGTPAFAGPTDTRPLDVDTTVGTVERPDVTTGAPATADVAPNPPAEPPTPESPAAPAAPAAPEPPAAPEQPWSAPGEDTPRAP